MLCGRAVAGLKVPDNVLAKAGQGWVSDVGPRRLVYWTPRTEVPTPAHTTNFFANKSMSPSDSQQVASR